MKRNILSFVCILLISLWLTIPAIGAGDEEAVLKEITGLVQVQKLNIQDWGPAQENMTLSSGDRIRSFLESGAVLVFSDGSEFALRENTSLDLKDISEDLKNNIEKRELKLNLGSLQYKVPPKKEKAVEFKIYSSTSIVGITGTEGVITAKGDGKLSENILMEGATYNTDDQGKNGRYQKSGNIYRNDGAGARVFSADVQKEAGLILEIDQEYVDLIKNAVADFKRKKDEGYRVGPAQEVIRQAFFYLEKREYDLVRQMVEQVTAVLEQAQKIQLPEDLDAKMRDTNAALNDKEREGYDVSQSYVLLAKAQGLKQNGEFGDIRAILTQIEKDIALLMEGNFPVVVGGSFFIKYEDLQKSVLEKGQQGFATSEIRALMREAQMFYGQDEKPRAYLFLKEAEDQLALTLKAMSDGLAAKIVRLEEDMASKKALGYPAKELELRLDKVKTYLKEEDYLQARESILAVEEGLSTLTKGISADWQLKVADLRNEVNYLRSIGYTLEEIPGLVGAIVDYQEKGDLTNLEITYDQVKKEIAALKIPAGFEADWKDFLQKKETKIRQGYNSLELKDLTIQIQTAVDARDIKSARLFLDQAKKTLNALKDQDPPKVQVISFSETEDGLKVEGFASDDVKVKYVTVNGSLVELTEEGKFLFHTAPNPLLKTLTIAAVDMEGNVSAPVNLTVSVPGKVIDAQAELRDVTVEYTPDEWIVQGKFVPGGIVNVGTIKVVCNDKGRFAALMRPDRHQIHDTVAVTGVIAEGVATQETVLTIEDKWAPRVSIDKVSFDNSFVPLLNLDPLAYQGNKAVVSGQVILSQMANIEGRALDGGGEIASVTVEGVEADIREDGSFAASLTFDRSRKDPMVKIVAQDKFGNKSETQVALDPVWNWPSLTVNGIRTFQKAFGKFSKEITLTADMNDIGVVLEDGKGESLMSKRVPVAAVLSPELEIQDVRYDGSRILISGRTTADGTVFEKGKTIFSEEVAALRNVVFTLAADYPGVDQDVVLVAANIEGKLSEEVKIVVGPPKDSKAPVLYLSSPQKDKKGVIIAGFVEDESEVTKLTVQGAPVEIMAQGAFSYNAGPLPDAASVEVAASDIFGNEVKKTIVLSDKEKPTISIDVWEVKEGRLVIQGTAVDNVGVKEVRLNDMPIAVGESKELAFTYNGVVTEDLKGAVIVAVDLLNNQAQEGPREVIIPMDTTAPQGGSIGLKYGSPIVYASGSVSDPAGVKAVYVNGEPVEVFSDGTFDIKVSIDVGLPKVMLESPAYRDGKVAITGKVALADFTPAKITVESEDLSGNRGIIFSQDVVPYQIHELKVSMDGQVVDVAEDGSFTWEQPIVFGQRTLEVYVQDPFDNSFRQNQELENQGPILELDPLAYDAQNETVKLSGKVRDEGSGLSSVTVNSVRVDVSGEGIFSYQAAFTQGSFQVIATDYAGNATSLTKEVSPPDIWKPLFFLTVTPTPAIIGGPVHVEIAALDSRTRLPELLKTAPVVTADADGRPVALTVEGEGSNFIAALDTTGLEASLITVRVQGEDLAGNRSTEVEGTDMFALAADDTIKPSFTLEAVPSPIESGKTSTVKVYASEDLKTRPALEAVLPSGKVSTLTLLKSASGGYQAALAVPVEEGIGQVVFKLSGGEDLSGNTHETTEMTVQVRPPVTIAELPLNIHSIQFVADRFTLSGLTAPEAIVRLKVGEYVQDIAAGAQGMFRFEQFVSFAELQDMAAKGPNVRVQLRAHNYAGFTSREKNFDVPLPPRPDQGGTNFRIRLDPIPAGQGDMMNIEVEALKTGLASPKGFIYFPDGARAIVNFQGGNPFTARYEIPEDAALGTAVFEVVSGTARESVPFPVGLSDSWMQRLNKYDFFKVRVSRDPLIIGEQADFFVETMGDLPNPPRLEIRLPNGRVDTIVLSGSGRFFQGTYTGSEDLIPGQAELVLNPGLPEEIRRLYGIENRLTSVSLSDAFLFVNPNPLVAGGAYDVNVSFSRNVSFKPRLVLRLQNGRVVDMPLSGSVPANMFMAQGTLTADVGTGLAQFVLLDDKGMVMNQFPTQIMMPLSTSVGTDIFVMPDVLRRMSTATVQVNALIPISGRVEADVHFPDGTRRFFSLDGTATVRKGTFVVPDNAPLGMVTISVFNEGRLLGTVNTHIADQGGARGPVNISLDNPDFDPFESVQLNVATNWALSTIPKAELFWEGGSLKVTLTGKVPGNWFKGEFIAPKDRIVRGRIEIRDAGGSLLGDFPLDHGQEGEGQIVVTPMPPMIGQPLSIKAVAPKIVGSAPVMRLIFEDGGQKELNAYGPIPGDTFTASLPFLDRPIRLIEIVHEGRVVESIPVGYLSMPAFEFFVDTVDEMTPCATTDVIIRSNTYVPFTPYLSVDFNGRVMSVPLSKMSSMEFLGRVSVPCDVVADNFNMRLFDPQGKLLWQRNFSMDPAAGGTLDLNVMPIDAISFNLSWNRLSGVDSYEIRYGETAALGQTVTPSGVSNYTLTGLRAGQGYYFQVVARKNYQDIMFSNMIQMVAGGTTMELNVQHNVMDNDVSLYWNDYFGADMYRVQWGTSPAAYPNSFDVSTTNYYIQDLTMGSGYYIKVKALKNGQVIGESREIFVQIAQFVASGGEIYFSPDPPILGQFLMINTHFFQDLPFIPRIVVRLQDGDVTLTPTGQYRDFQAQLTAAAFDSPIISVDVQDPNGNIIASRAPVAGTYSGGMVSITVTPDPPVTGTVLIVRADFPQPPPFTPKLVIEFASGIKEYSFNQSPNLSRYEWNIPVGDMTSSILYMKVVNPNTGVMLGDRVFTVTQGGGSTQMPFTVTPNPPIVGQSVHMSLNTNMVVSLAPKLRIYFSSGMQEFSMLGGLPGQSFTYHIGSLTSPISKIDIVNPSTNGVVQTWNPGVASPTSCEITMPNSTPLANQGLQVRAQFPSPVYFTPRVRVYLMNGMTKDYTFSQSPGVSMYEIFIPSADITSSVNQIDIWNDTNSLLLGRRFYGAAASVSVQSLSVTPAAPGLGSQTLQVHLAFNAAVGFAPRWKLYSINGSFIEGYFTPSGQSVYDQSIQVNLTSPAERLEIVDNAGNLIPGGERFFEAASNFTCTMALSDDTLVAGDVVTVTATYTTAPTYTPRIFVQYNNSMESLDFSPTAGSSLVYSKQVSITNSVAKIGVGQNSNAIDCGREFGAAGNLTVDLSVSPNPTPNTGFTVYANFSQWVQFSPHLYIEFQNGSPATKDYWITGPGQNFTKTITAADVTGQVVRIVMKDDLGNEIMDDLVFAAQSVLQTPNLVGYELPAGTTGQIKVFWDAVSGVEGYRIYYGASQDPQTYDVEVGSGVSNHTISGLLTSTQYYVRVRAYSGNLLSGYDDNPLIYVFPSSSTGSVGNLTASPISLTLSGGAGGNSTQQSVSISNTGATTTSNVKARGTNLIYGVNTIYSSAYVFSPSSVNIGPYGSQSFSVSLNIPSGISGGLYAGTIRFWSDGDNDYIYDNGEAFVEVPVSVTVSSGVVHHIKIEADGNSSDMGEPIFVTLTAEDSSNNRVSSYNTPVTINVSESAGGRIPGSWILSTNDGPGGPSMSDVDMFAGIGNFTVDAQEPETLMITLSGVSASGSPLALKFTPNFSISAASGIAIIGPNRVPVGPDGGKFWVAIIDGSGQVVTNSTALVSYTINGSATYFPGSPHQLAVEENGQFLVTLRDNTVESVTFQTTSPYLASQNVQFVGVEKYLVYDGSSFNTSFTTQGKTKKFTLRAANTANEVVRSYDKQALFIRITDPTNNAYLEHGNNITFYDGIAELTLNNSEAPESILFRVQETGLPSVNTGSITVNFQSSDSTPPQITRVEMDTPWIVHIYFNEDVESVSAGEEDNYTVGQTVNKVCWYGDNVTLHLDNRPGGLGTTFNLTVDGVKDLAGNPMSNVNYSNILIPNVDFQGTRGSVEDWFEVQVSDENPSVGDVVHVTVYHKNVCGYLTGDNNVNKNVTVGNVSINYAGTLGQTGLVSGYPSSVDLSSGQADFNVTIASCVTAGTTIISASSSGVTTTTMGTINIPAGCN